MKWTIKPRPKPKPPEYGDERQFMCFAWFPWTMSDQTTVVWLARYRVTEVYVFTARLGSHWQHRRSEAV